MKNAAAMSNPFKRKTRLGQSYTELADLDALLRAMRGRHSSKPIDKITAIALPLQKRGFHDITIATLPIYDPSIPVSTAWERLISSIASTEMTCGIEPRHTINIPTIQLLRLFPHPSRNHWFPSWTQVQKYPDVSVRDSSPVMTTGGIDCSLRIMSGRIYRGCSLQLIQPPTPGKKAVYCVTMDGKCAQLEGTVPGVELPIDSKTNYVLVDISPDRSLWPINKHYRCWETGRGHEHQPIWQKSVIVVCEEVDALAQPAADTARVTPGSFAITRYNLRRVTTLEWECRPSADPGPGYWLPFEPSLVHMRSAVCSARGGLRAVVSLRPPHVFSPDVFCDPAVAAGLRIEDGWHEEWSRRCPAYEVYLV